MNPYNRSSVVVSAGQSPPPEANGSQPGGEKPRRLRAVAVAVAAGALLLPVAVWAATRADTPQQGPSASDLPLGGASPQPAPPSLVPPPSAVSLPQQPQGPSSSPAPSSSPTAPSESPGGEPSPDQSAAVAERVARTLRSDIAVNQPLVAEAALSVAEAFERDRGEPTFWPRELPRLSASAVLASRFDGRAFRFTATSGASFAQLVREMDVALTGADVAATVAGGDGVWSASFKTSGATVFAVIDDRSPLASPADPIDPAAGLLRTVDVLVVYDEPQFELPPPPSP